jgi:hypothetical protein
MVLFGQNSNPLTPHITPKSKLGTIKPTELLWINKHHPGSMGGGVQGIQGISVRGAVAPLNGYASLQGLRLLPLLAQRPLWPPRGLRQRWAAFAGVSQAASRQARNTRRPSPARAPRVTCMIPPWPGESGSGKANGPMWKNGFRLQKVPKSWRLPTPTQVGDGA